MKHSKVLNKLMHLIFKIGVTTETFNTHRRKILFLVTWLLSTTTSLIALLMTYLTRCGASSQTPQKLLQLSEVNCGLDTMLSTE
jgi:hypothetical protein